MSAFGEFLSTAMGQDMLRIETQLLQQQLATVVGYNCLQLSVAKGLRLCEVDSIGHSVSLGYAPGLEQQDDVWTDYQSLPVAHDCVDIVLLHHVLEFSIDPAQLLREADRTLVAGGYVLLFGFNPLSLWPLQQRYWHWTRRNSAAIVNASCKPIRQSRVSDWLSVLNYDILESRRLLYRIPLFSDRFKNSTQRLEQIAQRSKSPFGYVYFTLARKRTWPLNPLIKYWRQSSRLKPPVIVHSSESGRRSIACEPKNDGICSIR